MRFRKLTMPEIEAKSMQRRNMMAIRTMAFVCDNIRSALNVGSLFRTADALGVQRVELCGITACPPHREILKTALGASDSVPWHYHASGAEAARALRAEGFFLIGLEQVEGSQDLRSCQLPHQPVALFLGNEVDGLSDETLAQMDAVLEIPQWGAKHSLNVAVAAGVAAWEIRRLELELSDGASNPADR